MGFEKNLIRGVQSHYGPRKVEGKFGSQRPSMSHIKEVSWTFTYDNLPVHSESNKLIQQLPANIIPLEAYLYVHTAFASGTSYDIDLVEPDGTAIHSGEDKLWDALAVAEIDASVVTAAIKSSTHGGTNSGDALNVKTDEIAQLQVVATGTFTAGKATISLRYLIVPA